MVASKAGGGGSAHLVTAARSPVAACHAFALDPDVATGLTVRSMEAKRYTVGELAGATGLTVRTLHHYDRIGLLQPTDRSPSGYRLYGSEDVQRLYRILALRQLGLSLKDIDAALAGDWADLRQAIARHLAEVQRQVALSQSLEHKLRRLLDQVDRHHDLTNEQFIDAMETIVSFTHLYSG